MALLDDILATANDGRLSRSERRALRERLADLQLGVDARRALRHELFRNVADRLSNPTHRDLVDWLDDIVNVLEPPATEAWPASHAWFGPGDPMVETLEGLVRGARRTIDIAVFTLTDDRLATALLDATARNVAVRLLTDDDKAHDLGSDAHRLAGGGVDVRTDGSPYHFHHKFAVFDHRALVTGSYNWTRGADRHNRENFLLTHEPALVRQYADAFDALWAELAP